MLCRSAAKSLFRSSRDLHPYQSTSSTQADRRSCPGQPHCVSRNPRNPRNGKHGNTNKMNETRLFRKRAVEIGECGGRGLPGTVPGWGILLSGGPKRERVSTVGASRARRLGLLNARLGENDWILKIKPICVGFSRGEFIQLYFSRRQASSTVTVLTSAYRQLSRSSPSRNRSVWKK